MKKLILIFLFILTLGMNIGLVFAQNADDQDAIMLDNLRKMRMRQQGEEQIVVRVQQFTSPQNKSQCSAVQQARQRLKDIEEAGGDTDTENVNITAGHGELNVTDNHGTINSDISVQIIKQGGDESECL